MPDFPVLRNPDLAVISPASPWSLGTAMNAMGLTSAASAWPTANKAYYIPVSVQYPITVAKMFVINGSTVSGNIDVGIYDAGGAKLVTSGSTAQTSGSVIQEFDIADTLLQRGLYYWACAMDNSTGTLEIWNPNLAIGRAMGVCEQTSAFPLPATAVFALLATTLRFPVIGATPRTTI